MNNKTISILSYITIIGWVIAFVLGKNLNPKSDLVNYHLKQGLGLIIISFIVGAIITVIVRILPSLAFLGYINIVFLIMWIFGIINAIKEEKKPLPLIGGMFENKFGFIG